MKKWYVILAAAALLTSCHSSRRSTTAPVAGTEPPQTPTYPIEQISTPAASSTVEKIIAEARRWIGTPYCYGGIGRDGTDCSGMVMTIYRQVADIALPRNSARQQEACQPVSPDRIAPADLVFFSSKRSGGGVSHVGIYIGDKEFIHASTSRGVMISRLDEPYYTAHYHSAGRVPALAVKSSRYDKPDKKKKNANKAAEDKNTNTAQDQPTHHQDKPDPAQSLDSIREAVRSAMMF